MCMRQICSLAQGFFFFFFFFFFLGCVDAEVVAAVCDLAMSRAGLRGKLLCRHLWFQTSSRTRAGKALKSLSGTIRGKKVRC